MANEKEPKDLLLFEFFYSFKVLWKRYHNQDIQSLYDKLSKAKAGNKTMFDDIMAGKRSSIEKHKDDLPGLMGIQGRYIVGVEKIEPISSIEKWNEFTVLQRKGQARSEAEGKKFRELREKIGNELYERANSDKYLIESEVFKRLVYFCKYGERIDKGDIVTIFNTITGGMRSITKENLKKATDEDLKRFKNDLITMLRRIEAFEEMEKWK